MNWERRLLTVLRYLKHSLARAGWIAKARWIARTRWVRNPLWYLLLGLFTLLLVPTVTYAYGDYLYPQYSQPQFEQQFEQQFKQQFEPLSAQTHRDDLAIDDLDRGQTLYDEGQYNAAITVWQQALTVATTQNDLDNQAIAHNYLAIAHQALGEWTTAQTHIQQGLATLGVTQTTETQTTETDPAQVNTSRPFLVAQLLNTQGNGELQTGQAQVALTAWQQAAQLYRSLESTEAQSALARTQINQAQALRTLGFYRQAQTILHEANGTFHVLPDSSVKVKGLQSLGQTLLRVGDLEQAQQAFTDGLAIAQSLNFANDVAALQLSLGQTMAALGEPETAMGLYQQAQDKGKLTIQLEATLQSLTLALRNQDTASDLDAIAHQIQTIRTQLSTLPPSHWHINTQVYLATLLMDEVSPENLSHLPLSIEDIAQLLSQAVQQSRQLRDRPAEASALGQLGQLYEQTQQWQTALELTNQALQIAPQQADYATAQWQWQRGRILMAQQHQSQALEAYGTAVQQLNDLQYDLVALNPDARFSFRDQVEPIYRQYVAGLLTNLEQQSPSLQQTRLQQSRETIEALQLSELQNFFREACLTYQARPIEAIDPKAAIIYPIFLDERLEVITSVPGHPLQHYGVDLSASQQEELYYEVRAALNPVRFIGISQSLGQRLYDWIIRPAKANLDQANIDTLVFVPDGMLRNLPMAVLHDGDRYLIEQFNLALTPGLQLLNSQPLATDSLSVLSAGLTTGRQGFDALPAVETEISQIQQLLPAEVLLNDNFTTSTILDQASNQPFSVVHLATHGQFSASAEETFLLTWDDRLKAKDLDRLLQTSQQNDQPIELLVLSACQTAEGDSRSALGMAGMAVRSGARSTVATLWAVQDESTSLLMAEFYRLLATGELSRSTALRQAQLSLLNNPDYQHPYYWSPFVMIGNWQ